MSSGTAFAPGEAMQICNARTGREREAEQGDRRKRTQLPQDAFDSSHLLSCQALSTPRSTGDTWPGPFINLIQKRTVCSIVRTASCMLGCLGTHIFAFLPMMLCAIKAGPKAIQKGCNVCTFHSTHDEGQSLTDSSFFFFANTG